MIIWSIAKTTMGDLLRKKVLQIFVVVGIGLIIISFSFSQTLSFSTHQGSSTDLMLMKSFGLGLMVVAGMLISLFMGVSLIPQEIERRTIYTILSKPVNRYEFIIGKFLGAIMTLAINVGLMGLVFVLVVMFKAMGAEAPAATATAGPIEGAGAAKVGIFDLNTVLGVVMIYLQFMVLSSVVLMFSTFLTPTVNFFMGAGVYLLGSMSTVTKTIATSEQAGAALKAFYRVVSSPYVIPDIDSFNITNALLHPEAHITNLSLYTLKVALYAVVYSLLMMVVAILIFRKREV